MPTDADPYFKLRQEVYVVRNHCASCSELESQMQYPIKVRAIMCLRIASKMRRVRVSTSMKHASVVVLQATSRALACSAARASPNRRQFLRSLGHSFNRHSANLG